MSEEMIEEIDWEGNIIATHPKSHLKERMFPHKVSLIIPRSKDGGFILSRRAKEQEPWPNTWVCAVGGKAIAGETFEEAALREMEEEIGFHSKLKKVADFSYDDETYKAMFRIFTTKEPISISSINPNPKEIQYLKSMSIKELENSIINNPEEFAASFIPAAKEFIKNINN